MSNDSVPSSPSHSVVALVPSDHEWQPIFHVSNQVVLYNPTSHALSIRQSDNLPERPRNTCPYCKQSLPGDFEPDTVDEIDALDSDPAYHSRASDYFQLLAIANETSSRPTSPSPSLHEQRSTFPAEKMAEGYFKAFFQEEYKLGMGANGSVFLCQHVLDGNPLGHFAVKKIAVGESHSYLLQILREVRLLERLHHPNIVTYHHAWLETSQFSSFGPKVPTLHVLMQWAEGGSLDDFIDVRLGRGPQRIHADPLAPFTFAPPSSTHISSELPTSPVDGDESLGGESHSRSARIRAFRAYQRASPEERARMRREMELANAKGRWKAVHLLSAEEVKSLFQDVVEGLAFLHNKSILHLDLKPGNVLLTWDDGKLIPRAMLSDFGTSRDMLHNSRTRSGNTGTLEYTAPESLPSPVTGRLQQIDSKADMWSLGMILHKLLFFRLPYRYAAEGDANGDSISTEREGDKMERLEREVLEYPGFKATPAMVTAFEARRLPRTYLVLLESLLNVVPSARPSSDRVLSAIREGRLDPLKDDFLHMSVASSLVAVPHRRSDPAIFDVFDQAGPSTGMGIGDEKAMEEQQRTPTMSRAPIPVMEKAHLLGPPTPPLEDMDTGLTQARTLMGRSMVDVPRLMWKRAFKSCVLVAKVASIASMCPDAGASPMLVVFVLLFAAVLDTVVDEGFWISGVLAAFHLGVVLGCPKTDEDGPGRLDNAKRILVTLGPLIAGLIGFAIGAGVTPKAAVSMLRIIGFGPDGPIQGSLAAKLQSPDVQPGSYFAVAQSIGMGGPVPVYGIILGGVILGLIAFLLFMVIRAIDTLSLTHTKYPRTTGLKKREKEEDHQLLLR
ncbi:putative serine/threonine-protein kinase iksA [Hypsizygus marmoreus]|uniref:non-specific serine/threonine protein kinase n=1 Tax=Hypsizygus marmoreus TaxID=39966 RepID=A0A369K439_HYPMA|nr:putative serine/threonine-protein kinase iksA [Hypsizygus marmoreus]